MQKLAFSEVYQALQVGTVNAQENTWSNIFSKKFYEVQKDFTESNGRVIDYMVLVNAKWWNGLPADIRAGLTKAMAEATEVNNEIADKLNVEAKKKIAASGVTTIHELTPAQHAAWVKAMHPVWAKFERPDRQGYHRRRRGLEQPEDQLRRLRRPRSRNRGRRLQQ